MFTVVPVILASNKGMLYKFPGINEKSGFVVKDFIYGLRAVAYDLPRVRRASSRLRALDLNSKKLDVSSDLLTMT